MGLVHLKLLHFFLKRIKYERGIPFELKVPNATTLQAMEEAKNNDGETVGLNAFLQESESNAKTL